VVAIHDDQVREHGGVPGARDLGLVVSALERPRNKHRYGARSDLPELAAAYAYGLVRNHGFVDGNKRTAFQTMYLFLGLNGLRLDAPEPEVVRVMVEVAAGRRSERRLAEWVRSRVRRR
jgi:death-on-curing protein